MIMTDSQGELFNTNSVKITDHCKLVSTEEKEMTARSQERNPRKFKKPIFSLVIPINHVTENGITRSNFYGQDIPEEDVPIASPVSTCNKVMNSDLGVQNSKFKYFPEGTNLFKLKTTAVKMKLETRRPSYLEWKEKFVTGQEIQQIGKEAKEQFHSEFSAENIDRINYALSWMRNELEEMRRQDQDIAQKLLRIHRAIQNLRLEWSCQQHQQMLEDAKSDLDEMREIKRVSDLPLNHDHSLNELGFTNMNISLRKYSIF